MGCHDADAFPDFIVLGQRSAIGTGRGGRPRAVKGWQPAAMVESVYVLTQVTGRQAALTSRGRQRRPFSSQTRSAGLVVQLNSAIEGPDAFDVEVEALDRDEAASGKLAPEGDR